jgi:hypothetical protein
MSISLATQVGPAVPGGPQATEDSNRVGAKHRAAASPPRRRLLDQGNHRNRDRYRNRKNGTFEPYRITWTFWSLTPLRGSECVAKLMKARGKRYSARRRFFTYETLNPTEMNHEGHEDHEEIVLVLFCAFCGYLEERGRSRRYARFVSGRVWICLARVIRPRYRDRPRFTPLLFDPDTDTDPDPDSHTHSLTHTPPHTRISEGIRLNLRRGGDAAALPASRISCGHSS